jgi:hypothetical protein
MLNLEALKRRLEEALNNETEESLKSWVSSVKRRELFASIKPKYFVSGFVLGDIVIDESIFLQDLKKDIPKMWRSLRHEIDALTHCRIGHPVRTGAEILEDEKMAPDFLEPFSFCNVVI